MAKDERFVKVYSQGALTTIEILVDRETGVNYMFRSSGYAGGMCPIIDSSGKPIVTPISDWDDKRY